VLPLELAAVAGFGGNLGAAAGLVALLGTGLALWRGLSGWWLRALAFAALCSPGDTVLAEAQTYPGMRALANVQHLRLAPVVTDADGLLPDAVEAACRRGQARVLYCMPTMQNPTGTVMPLERREALVAVARRYGVSIVEDDTYGFLCPEPPPPLARLAPERCHFVTSMSKSLAAGLRIGFLVGPEEEDGGVAATERLAAHVTAIAWMAAPLMAELVGGWVLDGRADRLVEWKRREVIERRRIFLRRLGDLGTDSHPGSSHLWLPLPAPWRSGELVAEARRRGVSLAPAEAFAAGRANGPPAVRVCIGTPPTRREVDRGLATLATILARSPLASPTIV